MSKHKPSHHSYSTKVKDYKPSLKQKKLSKSNTNIKLIKDKPNPKRERHQLQEPTSFNLSNLSNEQIHNFINNRKGQKQNEMLVNYLLQLSPFSLNLERVIGSSKEEIIRKMAMMYKSEYFPKGKILFKYGDNADKFYIIHHGTIDIFFPYYETNTLTEEEFFIYLLRLKRYEENQMLNNVLLLNHNSFLFDNYNFDTWIKHAYYTWVKLQIDPNFIHEDNHVKKKKNSKKNIKKLEKEIGEYNYEQGDIFINENEVFDLYEKKILVIALENELLLTVNKCFPEILYDIKKHSSLHEKFIIKKRYNEQAPYIHKNENEELSNLTQQLYMSRFLITSEDTNTNINYQFKSKKIIVLKYFHVCTLQKGESFGDILSDSMSLFTQEQLEKLREASLITRIPFRQFQTFRIISAIASENSYMGYITKKFYLDHIKIISEKLNFKKLHFIQNHNLFLNTSVPLLLKTFSLCFTEKKLKQGEYLIKENDYIQKSNTNLYFIINGEFESTCSKSINQLDKLLTEMGYQSQISQTYPKPLTDLIDTPYYDKITRKTYTFKLNFIQQNDIVGLSEVTKDSYYSNSVICSSQYANVYEINSHIIRLLIENDKTIAHNKNIILKHKYQILAESLLKQRKIKLDCFFLKEKAIYQLNRNSCKIENGIQKSFSNSDMKNTAIATQPILAEKNEKKVNFCKISERFETVNKSMGREWKECLHKKLIRTYSAGITKKKADYNNLEDENRMMKYMVKSASGSFDKKGKSGNEEDLDVMLVNSTGKFTKEEIRMKKSKVFLERMREKMKKRMKYKGEIQKDKGNSYKSKRMLLLSGSVHGFIYNKKIKKMLLDEQNKLSINYDLQNKENSGIINPLIVDDFNRVYNTSYYYHKLFNSSNSNSISTKKNNSNFELNFNVVDNNMFSENKAKYQNKSSSTKHNRTSFNYQLHNLNPFLRYKLGSPRKQKLK